MKKRLFWLFFALFLITSSAQAQTILNAEAMENFSTSAPASTFSVKATNRIILPDGTFVEEGSIVSGCVTKVQNARRLKQDGYFEFVPDTIISNGKTLLIENPTATAKVVDFEQLDTKQIVEKVAKTAAGIAVKGATQGISFIQGVIQDEEGQRLKSGITKVYKDSPLSYIEEGSELNVKMGDTLTIIVKEIKTEN